MHSTVLVKINQILPESTCSVVLVVSELSKSAGGEPVWQSNYILKVFDRRFSTELRQSAELDAYTTINDKTCREYVKSGDIPSFLSELPG